MWTDTFGQNAGRMLSLLVLFATLAGCTKVEATAPEGFAGFDDGCGCRFRAVSADGVMYRVRVEDNDPEAELKFWSEALKKRMTDAGYAFVADSELKVGEAPAYLLEVAAPVGLEDYSYLITIFVRGSDLVIAEATGEVSRLAARRDAVLAAMKLVR